MTDDIASIPRARRASPTRRKSLRDRTQQLADLDQQGLTLYGLPVERGATITKSQLILSTRHYFRDLAKREKKRKGKAKLRCL